LSRVKVSLPGGARGPLFGSVAAVVLGAAAVAWVSLTQDVESDEFAIRQIYFGPNQGLDPEPVGPGWVFVLPGYERLHKFPRDMQILDMNDSDTPEHAVLTEDYTLAPAIRIQTNDGFQVSVDITTLYRIADPYLVVTKVGPGRLYETNVVARVADKILRQSFGRLEAEDFYKDYRRMDAEEEAREKLTAEMQQWGVQIWGVVVRDYTYDERFQHQIEARKIEDQRKFKNQAETQREMRQQEKNRRVADMQRQIEELRGTGELAVRKIKADADRYYRTEVAEGDRALALAQADAARMERSALDQAGASNIVGLEMAEAMEGVDIIVVSTTGPSGVNPLDLDSLVEGW
jgi:regulator of protease activity HflC (stomatin/prohibitin superfamily)